MEHAEALESAEATLHRAGFRVSRRCTARTSCFDFAARDEERLIFVKAFPDIRDVSREDAACVRAISRCFSSASIFISDVNNEDSLRDDTVYSRYGVYVVTSNTFTDIVLRGVFPLVEATPGGYCVRIDGSKIRERRHELSLSIGKLAGMIGVSRRTLYGYEKGMTRASVSAAYRLEKILGVPLARSVSPFEAPSETSRFGSLSVGDLENVSNRFLRFVLSKLAQFDFRVSLMRRAPFDFTADCPHAELKVIGVVLEEREECTEERVEETLSVSRIVAARPLLVGHGKVAAKNEVAFLNYDELARIRDGREITRLL